MSCSQKRMATYLEEDAVKTAKKKTEEHEQSRPTYTSRWESRLQSTLDDLSGRQFTYDVQKDPVYDSYRRAYTRKGRLAMEDTLGKTTALTGGYGNSYAATAAQDSYNGYMQALTDKIPELYQLAQERYDRETEQLHQQYKLYLEQEDRDRDSFESSYDRWLEELELLQDQEGAAYDQMDTDRKFAASQEAQKYDQMDADRKFAADREDAEYDRMDTDRRFEADREDAAYDQMDTDRKFQASQEAQKYAQMDADRKFEADREDAAYDQMDTDREFAEDKRRYDLEHPQKPADQTGGTTSSGSTATTRKNYDNGSVSEENIKKIQKVLGVKVDGKWGAESRQAAGDVSADVAWANYCSEFGAG